VTSSHHGSHEIDVVKDLQIVRSFVHLFLELKIIGRMLEICIFMKITIADNCHLGCHALQVRSSNFKMETWLQRGCMSYGST
jgi:hypothetical protein